MGRPRKGAFDEDTAIRVLRAAEDVFADRGFADARLEDIAERASIRRSSLLYHFGSKDKLYQEVVTKAFAEIAGAMARGMEHGETFEEKIDGMTDELIEFAENHEPMLAIVFRAMMSPNVAGHQTVGANFVVLIDQLEQFVVGAGRKDLPRGLPVRAILVQVVFAHLARSCMGELGDEIWKGDTHTRKIVRKLLLDK